MFKAYRKSIRLKAWAVEQISVTVYPMIMETTDFRNEGQVMLL